VLDRILNVFRSVRFYEEQVPFMMPWASSKIVSPVSVPRVACMPWIRLGSVGDEQTLSCVI